MRISNKRGHKMKSSCGDQDEPMRQTRRATDCCHCHNVTLLAEGLSLIRALATQGAQAIGEATSIFNVLELSSSFQVA